MMDIVYYLGAAYLIIGAVLALAFHWDGLLPPERWSWSALLTAVILTFGWVFVISCFIVSEFRRSRS